MQKLLYITPHLSTGGAPQYLLKKIELLKNEYDISLIEYTDLGGTAFVVQKNKIFNIIPPEKRITLGEDKTQLLDFLDKVQPDIVHLEEIPEMFMDDAVAKVLYDKDRNYTIFETSHDSSQNPSNKRFFPDKFMFVSNWQIEQYKNINVPSVLVEYPIEYKENKNKEKACKYLGLDPNKKHIIHVGLFTPRKNQSEFFEYAHAFPEYEFHCIGNQAGNFKHYWEPLMKNKPDNLTWWGERSDVDNFYEAADLFLFTSKGNTHDKETMPLVIREALSWKLPILIYNLEVYQNYFNTYPVKYLTDNKEQNIKNIKNIMEGFKIVSSPITADDFDINFEGENKINFLYKKEEKFDCKIVVKEKHSNIPIYWFEASFANYGQWWCIPIQNLNFKNTWLNEFSLDFYTPEKEFLFSKDLFVREGINPTVQLEFANPFDCVWHNYTEMFINHEYDFLFEDKFNTVLDVGANVGLFSQLCIKNGTEQVYSFEPNPEALINLKHFSSLDNKIKVIDKALNTNDEDLIFYTVPNNTTISSFDENHVRNFGEPIKNVIPSISLKTFIKENNINKIDLLKLDIEGAEYGIIETLTDKEFNIIDRFLIEWHNSNNGEIKKLTDKILSKGYSLKKIFNQASGEDLTSNYLSSNMGTFLAVKDSIDLELTVESFHLLTKIDDKREIKSLKSLLPLTDLGIGYTPILNTPYTNLPPSKNCARPDAIALEPGDMKLSPGHYGCYKAHTDAILKCTPKNDTAYLFFECDAVLTISPKEFLSKVKKAYRICLKHDYDFFSFGPIYKPLSEYEDHITSNSFFEAHAYLIPGEKIKNVQKIINSTPWDVFDLWATNNYNRKPIGHFKQYLCLQAKGYSLIDKNYSEKNYLNIDKL